MPTYLRLLITATVSLFIVLLLIGIAQAMSVWYPQAKLSASDGQAGFGFGQAIAVDQDTIAVSSGYKDRGEAVSIFVRSGSTWVQQAQLFDTQTDSGFGRSIALQGDTLVVTAPYTRIPNPPDRLSEGAAYIYTRTGSTWNRQAMLVPSEPYSGHWFGNSVAIDGNTVVVGQNQAAYVFERDATRATWSYRAKLVSPTQAPGRPEFSQPAFGPVVAINGDTIAVGGGLEGANCVTLFQRNPQTQQWSYQSELWGNLKLYYPHTFGQAVAIEGNLLVVGDPRSGLFTQSGVYVFERDVATGDWRLKTKLRPPRFRKRALGEVLSGHGFGASIAIQGDYIAVGAYTHPNVLVNNREGNAYLFRRHSRTGQWRLQAQLRPDSQTREYKPRMSLSGQFVAVGDTEETNEQGTLTGAAYVFELESIPH